VQWEYIVPRKTRATLCLLTSGASKICYQVKSKTKLTPTKKTQKDSNAKLAGEEFTLKRVELNR